MEYNHPSQSMQAHAHPDTNPKYTQMPTFTHTQREGNRTYLCTLSLNFSSSKNCRMRKTSSRLREDMMAQTESATRGLWIYPKGATKRAGESDQIGIETKLLVDRGLDRGLCRIRVCRTHFYQRAGTRGGRRGGREMHTNTQSGREEDRDDTTLFLSFLLVEWRALFSTRSIRRTTYKTISGNKDQAFPPYFALIITTYHGDLLSDLVITFSDLLITSTYSEGLDSKVQC